MSQDKGNDMVVNSSEPPEGNTNPTPAAPTVELDSLYSDKTMSLKRSAIMDMINGILLTPRKESSAEAWKMYIDACLDQLETSVYLPWGRQQRIETLKNLSYEPHRRAGDRVLLCVPKRIITAHIKELRSMNGKE